MLWRTRPVRVLVVASLAKAVALALRPLAASMPLLEVFDGAATLALSLSLCYVAVVLLFATGRRLLWRVRRKLILSYIFIGLVPALLIIAFFVVGGLLMFFNVSSYLFKRGFEDLIDQARTLASTTALDVQRVSVAQQVREIVERRLANSASRYPGISLALVPTSVAQAGGSVATPAEPFALGPWRHMDPPSSLPPWVSHAGFGGIIAYVAGDTMETRLVVRAAGLPDDRTPGYAIVVDIPVDGQVAGSLRETTGIDIERVSAGEFDAAGPPGSGRVSVTIDDGAFVKRRTTEAGSQYLFNWVTFFDCTDWASGNTTQGSAAIRVSIGEIYDRISGAQSQLGGVSLGSILPVLLGIMGALFLTIEIGAFVAGLVLARSITGSIHALFAGTQRVRQGDFSGRIQIKAKDQLGELANSFNEMTASIENLLLEAAEKKRLEQELAIARKIQMSLLPRGPLLMTGLSVAALCVPAREVGGDYYDFFPLSEHRLGVLIADVSGKGTSAALYMAELKGLVLGLSHVLQSPRQLLVEVNRIISDNLDGRSFITMTYAVVDLRERTLTYARAGHTPLMHLPAPGKDGRAVSVLTPGGMVLGLCLPGIAERFEHELEEQCIGINSGDLFVLYTDGITETMNSDMDMFGESRLSHLVLEQGHLALDELRERIVREVEAFAAGAVQHDDMTMILLKIDGTELTATQPERDSTR